MNRRLRIWKLFLPLLFWAPVSGMAQLADFNVQLLNESDGVRTSNIHKMVKDVHGFLWTISPRYVQRFDGQNVKRFDAKGEDLLDIISDQKGQIWISTQNTVKRFVDDRKGFRDIKLRGPVNTKFNVLQLSSDNLVWVISGNGLFVYDNASDTFLHHPVPSLKGTLFYRKIFQKYGNEFFIGNTNTLFAYNVNTKKVRSIAFEAVTAIAPFNEDILWATNARLQVFELNFKTGQTRAIHAKDFGSRAEFMEVNNIVGLGAGQYLVNTSKGCYRYERASGIFRKAVFYHNGSELANNEVYTSYYDRDQTLWMLTRQGIIFFRPQQHTISWLRNFTGPGPDVDWNNNIRALTGDNQNNIWLATAEGLSRLSLKEGKVKSFQPSNDLSAPFRHPSIQGIVFDGKKLVLGPGSGGPIIFDPLKGSFNKPVYPAGSNKLIQKVEQDYIYSIVRLINGDLLVLADASCYLIQKDRYQLSELRFTGSDFILQTAAQDSAGKIWIGTFKGLLLLDKGFNTIAVDTTTSPSKIISSLLVRNDSVAWAGSVGVFEFTKTRDGLRRQQIIPELANQQITMLFQDKTGQVWIGADDGFYRYDIRTKKLEWFDIWDNVQNKQLNPNSLFQAADGTLYLGGNNGLNYFHPEKIGPQRKDLTVLFTAVKINENDSLYSGQPLDLKWNHNSIEIQFVTTYFQNAQKVRYRYKLSGLDSNWVANGNNNSVRFSSLPPGSYHFYLQASLDGISWSKAPAPLVFLISPPLWRETWFILLAALLVIFLGYYLFKQRIAVIRRQQAQVFALKSKASELEKEKALAMYEGLKQQLNPHFLFNSLTSLDSLIWQDAAQASGFLEGLSRTYRYILKNREKQLVPLSEEIHFAQSYISLQATRFAAGLQVNIQVPARMHHFRIAPVTLQNLMENAIKHNVIGQDEPLVIDIFTEGQWLVVRNNLQKKNFVETSNKQGLANLVSLYGYLSPDAVQISESEGYFTVKVPLV